MTWGGNPKASERYVDCGNWEGTGALSEGLAGVGSPRDDDVCGIPGLEPV